MNRIHWASARESESTNNEELPNFKPFPSVELTPGCLLFVPAGCPHKVENLEDSIAVSGNFVNESNIGEAEKHLRISALQDPRAGDLLREFHNLGLLG